MVDGDRRTVMSRTRTWKCFMTINLVRKKRSSVIRPMKKEIKGNQCQSTRSTLVYEICPHIDNAWLTHVCARPWIQENTLTYTSLDPSRQQISCIDSRVIHSYSQLPTCFTIQIPTHPSKQFSSKKHLEYVHNIEQSTYIKNQSARVKITEVFQLDRRWVRTMCGHVSTEGTEGTPGIQQINRCIYNLADFVE